MKIKKLWRYRCFLTDRGICLIHEWHKTISKKGRAKFQRAIEHLAAQPDKSQWGRPHASPLGNHIYVIRFKDENSSQHRVFGHFHGDSLVFIFTLTGIEKDNVYSPSDYEERAGINKCLCDTDFNGRTKECFVLATHRAEDDLLNDTTEEREYSGDTAKIRMG